MTKGRVPFLGGQSRSDTRAGDTQNRPVDWFFPTVFPFLATDKLRSGCPKGIYLPTELRRTVAFPARVYHLPRFFVWFQTGH